MMKKEEFQKSEWIPFIQKSKSLDELQKEYKGNERIRKNLALIVEDVMAQWEIALSQISNSNDGAENSSSQPLTNQSVNIIINNNFNTNFEPPQDQPLYPKLDELEAPPLNDNTPIMTITNNDDQKSDPMDISEDDVVNEHQNTTTNGIEQTHLSNEELLLS
ncbi:hypothetical protein C9374_003477 [Naegleria lovaniensis]|uniref:Uncharacterized protein n=1 Tax=Naegleria lovaniensis TaxID=51637 RepID=A0AA88KPR0_NAELO|nr:uncharacterized protein C9374_003477 [Naegleria lovaniensis]KAG2385662.1 hypothetical protein C9374_003477 [Naegleria lovaniensis]